MRQGESVELVGALRGVVQSHPVVGIEDSSASERDVSRGEVRDKTGDEDSEHDAVAGSNVGGGDVGGEDLVACGFQFVAVVGRSAGFPFIHGVSGNRDDRAIEMWGAMLVRPGVEVELLLDHEVMNGVVVPFNGVEIGPVLPVRQGRVR